MKTADMFANLKPPRKKPRVLMHVCDAGEGEGKPIAQMKCNRCGHESDWLEFNTVSEAKRGIPCPNCNGTGNEDELGEEQTAGA